MIKPYFILKSEGKYFNGNIGWSGIGLTTQRLDAEIYNYLEIQSLKNTYNNICQDFDFELISEVEAKENASIKNMQRQLKFAINSYTWRFNENG